MTHTSCLVFEGPLYVTPFCHVSPKLDEQINVRVYVYVYLCVHVCVYTCSVVAVALNLYPIIASNSEVVPACRILCVLPVDPAVVEILHRKRQKRKESRIRGSVRDRDEEDRGEKR